MGISITRTCPTCGTGNRVPAKHLADTGKCGSCKAALPPLNTPLPVDAPLFDEIVRDSRVPVFVDFWADWCGPCRTAAPEVAGLAKDLAGAAVVLKVDTQQNPGLASRYQVQGIPNFLVLHNGKVVFQRAGVAPKAEMRRWIEQSISI